MIIKSEISSLSAGAEGGAHAPYDWGSSLVCVCACVEKSSAYWRGSSKVPTAGPFAVGHPENPEWLAKSDERSKRELNENR